ncbi:MAG: MipA/OmpV family protein [Alphaproteobacteria bacterium]
MMESTSRSGGRLPWRRTLSGGAVLSCLAFCCGIAAGGVSASAADLSEQVASGRGWIVTVGAIATFSPEGVFADYWLIPELLRTRIELRHGFRDDDGFVADFGADIVRRSGRFTLSAGPRLTVADGDAMNLKFGVSQAAAARSVAGLAAFDPDAGIQSVGATVALRYELTENVTFIAYDRYDHLGGDAADSPIVKQLGSTSQNTVGVGLTYSFHTNW